MVLKWIPGQKHLAGGMQNRGRCKSINAARWEDVALADSRSPEPQSALPCPLQPRVRLPKLFRGYIAHCCLGPCKSVPNESALTQIPTSNGHISETKQDFLDPLVPKWSSGAFWWLGLQSTTHCFRTFGLKSGYFHFLCCQPWQRKEKLSKMQACAKQTSWGHLGHNLGISWGHAESDIWTDEIWGLWKCQPIVCVLLRKCEGRCRRRC